MRLVCPNLLAVLFVLFSSFNTANSSVTRDETNRKQITQAILDNLVKEKYEDVRKDFHSTLRNSLPTEKIAETWQTVISSAGQFKEVISTSAAQTQGFNQIRMRIKLETENATLETTFNEDDKVVGLWIKP
jgi:hypothetical protein